MNTVGPAATCLSRCLSVETNAEGEETAKKNSRLFFCLPFSIECSIVIPTKAMEIEVAP